MEGGGGGGGGRGRVAHDHLIGLHCISCPLGPLGLSANNAEKCVSYLTVKCCQPIKEKRWLCAAAYTYVFLCF